MPFGIIFIVFSGMLLKQRPPSQVKKKIYMPLSIEAGASPSELRTLFDRVAGHFPGHTMQRVRLPDRQFRYTYASPGMLETFGLDPASIVAEPTASHDWVHSDDRARFLAALHRSADRLETLDVELRVTGADGRMRWVRSIGHPRAMPDGSVVWDGIALDVTARRETEAALDRMVQLARDAEAAQSALAVGEPGRIGRALAAIGRHLDAVEAAAPHASGHVNAVRAELSGLLEGAAPPAPVLAMSLTPRQTVVLQLLGEGATNEEIGRRLGIGTGTAKLHVSAVLRRLGVRNRLAAVNAARRLGQSSGNVAM